MTKDERRRKKDAQPIPNPESQIQNPKPVVSAANLSRIGVLGGTFDPPHYGHLLLADTARVQLHLDRVLFAPAGQPPHKPAARPSPVMHRVALLQAALSDANEPAFCLSRVDLDRPGPHYTVDALALLQKAHPQAEMWFLVGADSLADLTKWRDPARIVALARLGVLARPGAAPDLGQLSAAVPGLVGRIDWLIGPSLEVSSSALRERARQGLPLRFLVPPAVETYLSEHSLYT
jgi:nicotinate-nucleotide adenylyltransferase